MCKAALLGAEAGFVRGKSHKQLDLGGVDAFYGPKSDAICQNTRDPGLDFAFRHQTSGSLMIIGIQAK
ncbi:hypothetical protein TH15_08835 [Thalassospira profundimaris]|uniref:Uncharacterized protein n=1 Tax=Thalassospira indica TaxID=1891279 RepID=A0ABM6Y339_9PROT|nr:hypothetical protein DY252_20480 [Thalassospira indica]OAZ13712.1 hypothetical protein TH15_08835 [Thalassospira profundimaris]